MNDPTEPIVILAGLSAEDTIVNSPLQEFILEHIQVFIIGYIVLLIFVVFFLFVKFIAIPLFKTYVLS